MSAFDAQKKLEAVIANDVTPGSTSIDTLSSLKLLNSTYDLITSGDANIQKIAKAEIMYLNAAMSAINDNPALSMKFGTGFQAALAVADQLKMRQSERVTSAILDNVLEKATLGKSNDLTLNAAIKKINASAAFPDGR